MAKKRNAASNTVWELSYKVTLPLQKKNQPLAKIVEASWTEVSHKALEIAIRRWIGNAWEKRGPDPEISNVSKQTRRKNRRWRKARSRQPNMGKISRLSSALGIPCNTGVI